jgi:uncharacterized phiE125 gp8 family phage protein
MVLIDLTTTPTGDLPWYAYKAHLRMGSGFTDDDLQDEVLESYLRAAIAAIEARTGKILLTRQLSWNLTRWSSGGEQALPVAPVSSVISIAREDRAGVETLIEDDTYVLQADTHRPKIKALSGSFLNPNMGGTITIQFEAGFGPTWADIPADLQQAVFLLATHYYEKRSDTSGSSGLIPFGVMTLLEPHRTIRTFGVRS